MDRGCLDSLGDMDIIHTRAAENKVRMFTQMTRSHITNISNQILNYT